MKHSLHPAWLLFLAVGCAQHAASTRPMAEAAPAGPAPRTAEATPQPAPQPEPASPGGRGIGDTFFADAGNGGYDVQSYDIAIALDRTDGPIQAVTTVRAKSTQGLSSFNFDFHGLEVSSIDVDGASARFERDGDELIVTPARAIAYDREFETVVRYSGVPEGVPDETLPLPGLKIGWLEREGEIYVFSQPSGAKSFFPCNDHPLDKALFTLRIDVPKPLQAIGNGTLAETLEKGERRTFVWKPRDPMATYLVTLAIGEFDEERIEGPNGLAITNYYTRKSTAKQRKDFARTDEIIDFLSKTFGPYPFESCGNILSNLRLPAALETQTIPVYGQSANQESVICHEQAHQWFGDAISVADWKDIWINEGFAEYAAWMYQEAMEGAESFEKQLRAQYALAKAFGAPPPGRVNIETMFGAAVYVRGPLALHALRERIGDELFLDVMRTWVVQHKNGNATVAQFLELVEKKSSKEGLAALEPWLYDDEMPSVAEWDAQIEQDKQAREERRKQRDEERRKKKEAEEAEKAQKDGEAKDGEAKDGEAKDGEKKDG